MSTTTTRRAGEPLIRFVDNPLMIAQARRRLRKKQIAPSLMVLILISVSAMIIGALIDEPPEKAWFALSYVYFFLMAVLLYYRATLHIARTAVEEKQSGLLDFHRATPTTPWTDGLGYLLGGSARELLMVAVMSPFAIYAFYAGGHGLMGGVIAVSAIVISGLLYHSLALLLGLKAGGRGAQGGLIAGLFILFSVSTSLAKAGLYSLAYLSPMPLLLHLSTGELASQVLFFGLPVPAPLFFLLVQGSFIAFIFWGAVRKLRSAELPAFSKAGALAFQGVILLLLIGGAWERLASAMGSEKGVAVGAFLVVAAILASALAQAVTPSHLLHLKALARAAHEHGEGSPPPLSDGAPPWVAAVGLAMVSVGCFALLTVGFGDGLPTALLFDYTTLLGLTWILALPLLAGATAYYTRLCRRESSQSWTLLISFMILVMPLILTAIIGQIVEDKDVLLWIASVSPLTGLSTAVGLAVSTWAFKPEGTELVNQAAISLGITFLLAGYLGFQAHSASQALRGRQAPERAPGVP